MGLLLDELCHLVNVDFAQSFYPSHKCDGNEARQR
jgi:hypothetical protein